MNGFDLNLAIHAFIDRYCALSFVKQSTVCTPLKIKKGTIWVENSEIKLVYRYKICEKDPFINFCLKF